MSNRLAAALGSFAWDALTAARQRAAEHPDGSVDLSIGTPVDATPTIAADALAGAADSPGYPTATGTPALRDAMAGHLARRWRLSVQPEHCLPTIGSKEFISWLPTQLGLGADDVVVIPELAYPAYAVGARATGSTIIATDDLTTLGDVRPSLVWLNSPSNPSGRIASAAELRAQLDWARARGAVVASDECYLEFGWDAPAVSILDEAVSGGDPQRVLSVQSLSKSANLAGYRAGFVTGDPELIADLTLIRRQIGMIMPGPVQAAMTALLNSDDHIDAQRERYRDRRERLRPALRAAGLQIEHSEGALYLWATEGTDCWQTVDRLADHGIVVAPGEFYGPAGQQFVRVALTATDERVDTAVRRLTS